MTARYIVTADGEAILETDSVRIARSQASILSRHAITRIYERTPRGQRVELTAREMDARAEEEIRRREMDARAEAEIRASLEGSP